MITSSNDSLETEVKAAAATMTSMTVFSASATGDSAIITGSAIDDKIAGLSVTVESDISFTWLVSLDKSEIPLWL